MDKATLEAAARVCSEMSYTAKYHFDPDGAWCAGANAATNNCVIAILSLADQEPVAPVEAAQVYLVDGKQYTACDCPKWDRKCKCGLIARTLSTTEFSRCLLPVAAPPIEAKKGKP